MIVGTAGHIDHGKTSLVKTITGVDADRLKEEKARGVTIELGFAYWPQPNGVIGFVDAPGHERLVHTMLAGAHGIDRLLLVVAADDGPMPQTREHLEIATLLGIDRGAVALTKIDKVAPDRLDEARAEIAEMLAGTPLAGSPVFAVSNATRGGFGALEHWLRQEHAAVPQRGAGGLFRLAVDRCFVLQGVGVVVTGRALDGAVAVGDDVVVSPQGLRARVRSLRANDRKVERAVAGQRCALNLAGPDISRDSVARGDMVVAPQAHAPTRRIDARLRLAPGAAQRLKQSTHARLHHAAAEVAVRVVSLSEGAPADGDEIFAQLVLDAPIAGQALDRFVLRDPSASRTLGGGVFVDLRPPERKRRSPQRRAMLAAMARCEPADALAALLRASPAPVDLGVFARDRGAAPDAAAAWAAAAGADAWPVGRDVFALAREAAQALGARAREALAAFHDAHPDDPGLGLERLRMETARETPAPLFRAILRALAGPQAVALQGGFVRLASHAGAFSAADQALAAAIAPRLSGPERFRPPRVRDLGKTLGKDEAQLRTLMRRMRRRGLVDEVAQDHYFTRETLAEMVALAECVEREAGGWFNAAAFRDRLENAGGAAVGRKVAIQALEFFDGHGVTIRRGDLRRVNARRRDLFAPDHDDDVIDHGRGSSPVGRPDFKSGWGRKPVPGGFDSHPLPPDAAPP